MYATVRITNPRMSATGWLLAQPRGIAELPACGKRGLLLGHPLRDESVLEPSQVFLDLIVELFVMPRPAQQTTKADNEAAQSGYGRDVHGSSWVATVAFILPLGIP